MKIAENLKFILSLKKKFELKLRDQSCCFLFLLTGKTKVCLSEKSYLEFERKKQLFCFSLAFERKSQKSCFTKVQMAALQKSGKKVS